MLVVDDERDSVSRGKGVEISDRLVGPLCKTGCAGPLDEDSESVESGNESVSSVGSNCSCDSCSANCNCTDCQQSNNVNMDYMDEPEFDDYSDDSDQDGDLNWIDFGNEEDELSIDVELGSFHSGVSSSPDDDINDSPDLMDALSDVSDEATPQLTIAIEVDSSSSSLENMSASSGEEEQDDDDIYIEDEQDDNYEEDDDEPFNDPDEYVVGEDSDDSDSNLVYQTSNSSRASLRSDVSSQSRSRSRSRSPVSVPVPDRGRGSNLQPEIPPLVPTVPPPVASLNTGVPAQPSSSQTKLHPKNGLVADLSAPVTPNTEEEGESNRMCCICLDSESNHVVVPCGHMCLCEGCKDLLISNENHRKKKMCPLCKTKFSSIIRVYK